MRVRVRYAKVGKVRFLSHRDLARILERAVRRAGLPVAYSQGFSPRARLHFGLALSTGYESLAEYVDIDLDDPDDGTDAVAADAVADLLQPCLPTGVVVTASTELAPGTPSLQDAVTSSTWEFVLPADRLDDATTAAAEVLAATELPIDLVRKGKQVREDLRPLLLSLDVDPHPDGALLTVELGTKPRSVRPAELLLAMQLPEHPLRVVRTHQWIQSDGERREPIELAAPSPHASVRAS
ncbi:TIGR03936 family radical SAM-associated protein [Dermatobacter hominis]|uniref:TIGR03936 family radical SAM-associated protein n=1 Tax=Dermatobacter hominis TaxID=2884263 RepID=UPI001D121D61|nr:TIGR03936 family radical SAM-associated protein [Dermatobacter hominis]UDY35718.1 TIGR03936 family radical SAM-associated protein [Dermatobacter hominis]